MVRDKYLLLKSLELLLAKEKVFSYLRTLVPSYHRNLLASETSVILLSKCMEFWPGWHDAG